MNPIMSVPMDLQLQLHQQMLFYQQEIALRNHRPDNTAISNGWSIPRPGRGSPLPPEVQVELQNQDLWQQFHTQTTEMIITKLGRCMFPSIQLTVSGLERRARYCVLLEVAPASERRHKYVGTSGSSDSESVCGNTRGWTSAGPAEPQPPIHRRIFSHPDSPATGAHWMQHEIKFNKLKLTNNAVEPRNNVVLTSMHKYIPRIWIIRCNDATRLSDLYTHPASSFTFKETEFIAVTAYQNDGITKLKINNNPFAKGFRETGQSRCKRKFSHERLEGSSCSTNEEEANSFTELESNGTNHLEVPAQRPKTVSSERSSFDDSSVSSCGGISPPLPSNGPQNLPSRVEIDHEVQPKLHRPWLDSSTSFLPPRLTASTSPLSSKIQDLSSKTNYFNLLRPSFLMHLRLDRSQY